LNPKKRKKKKKICENFEKNISSQLLMNIIPSSLSKKKYRRYLMDKISDNIPRARRKKQKKQKQKMKNI